MSPVATLSIDATITERGQTTVPAAIRKMLGVNKGAITFKAMSDGTVVIEPKTEEEADPAIGAFLSVLSNDIARGNLMPLDTSMLDEIDDLVGGLDVDMAAPLTDD
ncbi:type II toxin-antitoxin system PrlF family antitoxin [Mycoplana sp. MJR14]|uniref:type II toxin-antitoxin system PrlF family antitoxin n=1 Tax=Mycoplana sp. MJR14 TaxID=3032583 RepID=UPI0023DCAB13|nr:type II toxin-antitoxin system PrlF family antitoxin [Mycoplana sp. MJR14]MDF1632019.1 type II toxin-antitoxin system PrlF family antitoxin [Mycoplana sp. MJR14]